MTDQSFIQTVFDIASSHSGAFSPFVFYNSAGNCLEVFLSDKDYYAKWLNPNLTVYLAEGTDEVVGLVITGISRLIFSGSS